MTRLVALLEVSADIKVIAPLVLRKSLTASSWASKGLGCRQIAMEGGLPQRIATAIDWLRRHFDRPFRIKEMAQAAHMSPSVFHQHFKAVTAMSFRCNTRSGCGSRRHAG